MRPTLELGELIATHMSVPGNISSERPKADFVMSGLRAATSANFMNRRKILSDVSDVLDCCVEELEFLFSEFSMQTASTAKYDVMVPDFRSALLVSAE